MKKNKNIALLVFAFMTFAACDIADPIESEVTEYPEFEVTGGQYIYLDQGTTFEDPGVTATAGGESIDVEVSGTVDTSTPGVYELEYSAVNADGFPATTTRYVAVGNQEVAFGRDLSGTYTIGSSENVVTQIQPGFYMNSDTLPPNGISVFMVDLGNGELIVPPQSSPFGIVAADPTVYPESSGELLSDTSFALDQYIACCGIYPVTFTK